MINKIEDFPLEDFKYILDKKLGIEFNNNWSFKKMDIGDLDSIELLMELEKHIDDSIDDDLWNKIENLDNFGDLISISRTKKIDSII
jgi:acyl carrier protein